jgi:hypothetical protein
MRKLRPHFKSGFKNPFIVGDRVQFLNKDNIWIDGTITGFKVDDASFKAIIKCNNPECKTHKVCVFSIHLKRI